MKKIIKKIKKRPFREIYAQNRGEQAYRLHKVYGFGWQGIAEEFGYASAGSARLCARRFAHGAMQMFQVGVTTNSGNVGAGDQAKGA